MIMDVYVRCYTLYYEGWVFFLFGRGGGCVGGRIENNYLPHGLSIYAIIEGSSFFK